MSDTSLVFNILAKDKASKTFDKIKGTAAIAGAAIGAALAAGVGQALDKSKSDALLAAQLGAGPKMAAEFGQISGNLYAQGFGETAADVSNTLKGVWQNGLVPEDALDADIEKVTGRVMTISTILGEESDRVSSTVSQMLRTGMAKSAEDAFNLLTRATQQGLNKNQDLLDTLNEYPTQFRKLGLDGTSALGLIGQAMKAGARDSDVAADALKEFSIRAIDGSKLSASGFKALGLNAHQMAAAIGKGGKSASKALDLTLDRLRGIKDPVKRSQAAVALFGTQAEDLGDALYAMDPSTAAAGLGKLGGAAQKAGDTLSNSAGAKLDAFRRKVQMGLVNVLGVAAGWIDKNTGLVKTLAIVLGPLVAIIGAIVAISKVWTIVQTALNIVMMANPIGLIILAIIAFVAIIVLAWKKSDTFRRIVTAAWQWVWDKVKAVGAWFKNTLWPWLKSVWTNIANSAKVQLTILRIAWQVIWDKIKAVANWFKGTLWPWIKGVWDRIGAANRVLKDSIVNAWNKVLGFFRGIPGKLGSIGSRMWNGFKTGFRAIINWIIGKWNSLSFSIPRIDLGPLGSFGGQTFRVPQIPYLAKGGNIARGGMAVVGDAGPEVVSLPRGAQVTPLRRSAAGADHFIFEFRGLPAEMKKTMRRVTRKDGRGSAQIAFGS